MAGIELETIIRIVPFFLGLFLFTLLGLWKPFRQQRRSLSSYSSNIVITFINSFLVKLLYPLSLASFANTIAQKSWGLFNILELDNVLNIILSFVVMDLVIYWQHRLFHKVPFLWRLHRVHHSDTDFDTTTALRFHPIEIILSVGTQTIMVGLLGINFWGILLFGSILNFSAMFNHGNFSLPHWLEKWIVTVFVTPDMHRVHHSVIKDETNSNYGFCLSLWDKFFGSYCSSTIDKPDLMKIGLDEFRDEQNNRIDQLLTQPFRRSSL